MKSKLRYIIILTLLLIGASACGVLDITIVTEAPNVGTTGDVGTSSEGENDQLSNKETPLPNAEPTKTPVVEPDYSFEPVSYHDEESGFELLYPSTWSTPGGQVIGSRGYNVQFYVGDEIKMGATVYRWDPKRNLEAWSEQRELAWTSSGTILSKTEWILEGEQVALAYVIESVEGVEAFFMLTTIGDRYFELAGDTDLELLAEIASTVRIPEFEAPAPIVDDLDCRTVTQESALQWAACNIKDGIVSRDFAALNSWMEDPFAMGYWQSEWTERTAEQAINELSASRLPSNLESPMAFTIDREQFPPLFGMDPDRMLAPEIDLAMVIYSEGWEMDGTGAALLFIIENDAGEFRWLGMIIAPGHFDK